MEPSFVGKVVLITGGAKGIGRACAEVFYARGCGVAVVDRNVAAGQALVESLGPRARFFECDVSDEQSVARVTGQAIQALGDLDFLIYSAGIQGAYLPAAEMSKEEWDRVLGVNLHGAFYAAKYALPSIQRKGGGCVVMMASASALHCQGKTAAYATSKAALLGLTRSIAVDYAPAIRCVALCPGSVDTPMLREAIAALPDQEAIWRYVNDMHLAKRIAQPREIAELAAFVCSDYGRFMTGQPIRIDGGLGITLGEMKG